MTPNEINALPTLRSEPWDEADRSILRDLFNIDCYDIDEELLEGVERRILFDEKLYLYGGPDDSTRITAVTFDGSLIAVVARYPSSRDYDAVHVVDRDGLRSARSHAQEFVTAPENFTLTGPDTDIPDIAGVHSRIHTMPDGEVRLVSNGHFDRDGNLIYDDVRFRREFDRTVRPMFEGRFEETKPGIKNDELRRAVLDCVDAAIPEALPRLRVDEADANYHHIGYILAAPDGSEYTIGWSKWNQGSYYSWVTPSVSETG